MAGHSEAPGHQIDVPPGLGAQLAKPYAGLEDQGHDGVGLAWKRGEQACLFILGQGRKALRDASCWRLSSVLSSHQFSLHHFSSSWNRAALRCHCPRLRLARLAGYVWTCMLFCTRSGGENRTHAADCAF